MRTTTGLFEKTFQRPPLHFLTALLFLCLQACTSKQNQEEKDFAQIIDTTILQQHLRTLADPDMEGRETASAGEIKAAQYIAHEFERMGLKPVLETGFEMPFTVYRDSLLGAGLWINGKALERGKDFDVYLNCSHHHDLKLSEIVFLEYGIATKKYNDYQNKNVQGRIAVVNDGEPMQDSVHLLSGTKEKSRLAAVREKLKYAMKHKAAALFIVRKDLHGEASDNWGRMYTADEEKDAPIPVYFICEKTKHALYQLTLSNLPVSAAVRVADSCKTVSLKSRNVMAILEGTDKKDEYIFITGHYDHLGKKGDKIYCGADDNASGTSGVLAIARAFAEAKKAGEGPRRSIVFMLVSGEEKGLLGSKYYTAHPVFPMKKTSVNLNIDMIGRVGKEYTGNKDSANYIYVIGDDKLSSELRTITEKCNKKTGLVLDRKYNDLDDPNRFYYRSDHYNFAKNGVPIIFYFNGVHRDYHQPGDTMEKINWALMCKRARLVFYTAWEMANMERMLKRDIQLEE